MKIFKRCKVWGYDHRWLRVELFDDRGNSLGMIYFEPNENLPEHRRRLTEASIHHCVQGMCEFRRPSLEAIH